LASSISERHDEVVVTQWSTYLCCCSGIVRVLLVAGAGFTQTPTRTDSPYNYISNMFQICIFY